MREILFRAKETFYGEWVEGYYEFGYDAETETPTHYMWVVNHTAKYGEMFMVIPETIGQYTGLTDINGKKIFEGDIVSFERVNALGYTTARVGEVKYYTKLPIFYVLASTGDAWDWVDCQNIKVIGNIHDNPELLND